jgi:hypothetical protein
MKKNMINTTEGIVKELFLDYITYVTGIKRCNLKILYSDPCYGILYCDSEKQTPIFAKWEEIGALTGKIFSFNLNFCYYTFKTDIVYQLINKGLDNYPLANYLLRYIISKNCGINENIIILENIDFENVYYKLPTLSEVNSIKIDNLLNIYKDKCFYYNLEMRDYEIIESAKYVKLT